MRTNRSTESSILLRDRVAAVICRNAIFGELGLSRTKFLNPSSFLSGLSDDSCGRHCLVVLGIRWAIEVSGKAVLEAM
jgi:hypothetical protein